jgi:hypothetical protein
MGYFFLVRATAVISAVRGMDRITPMEPDTLLTTSVDSKAELIS